MTCTLNWLYVKYSHDNGYCVHFFVKGNDISNENRLSSKKFAKSLILYAQSFVAFQIAKDHEYPF